MTSPSRKQLPAKGHVMSKQTQTALELHRSNILSVDTLKQIREALPAGLAEFVTPERFAKIALSTVGRSEALWQCRAESVVRAIVTAAEFGLELTGGPLSNAYLVPYKNDCQLIISWPGLVSLARRGGEVVDVKGMVIYEADDFEYEEGLHAKFAHRPNLKASERGSIIAAYCLTTYANGVKTVNVMHREDIDRRRLASPSGNFKGGPWDKWYDQMAIKSVIKLAAKTWPKTPELSKALLREDEDEGFVPRDVYETVLTPVPPKPPISDAPQAAPEPNPTKPDAAQQQAYQKVLDAIAQAQDIETLSALGSSLSRADLPAEHFAELRRAGRARRKELQEQTQAHQGPEALLARMAQEDKQKEARKNIPAAEDDASYEAQLARDYDAAVQDEQAHWES